MEMIREWRKQAGLSAEEAGRAIGVSAVQWFRIESGARRVAADKALDVERLTGISRHVLRPDIFGARPGAVAAA